MIQDAYIYSICITPMHVNIQVVSNMLQGGVHVGRAKCEYFVHSRILCGTCVIITQGG